MNDILGAKFVIDGNIAPGFLAELERLEKKIQNIGKSAAEVATLLGTNGTASDRVLKKNKTSTRNIVNNIQEGINDDFRDITTETGKVLRRTLIGGFSGAGKTGGGAALISGMQASREILDKIALDKHTRQQERINKTKESIRRLDEKHQADIHAKSEKERRAEEAYKNKERRLEEIHQTKQNKERRLEETHKATQLKKLQIDESKTKESIRRLDEKHQADIHAKSEKERRAEEAYKNKERRLEEIHKAKQRKLEEAHVKKITTKRGAITRYRDGYINEASFGGIYLTLLASQAVTAPYRAFRDYEKEVIVAAKNVDGLEIQSPADIRKYGERRILSRYANANGAEMQFGVLPIDVANVRGKLIQGGFKDVDLQDRKELNKAQAEIFKMASILEADIGTAIKLVSYGPEFFKKEFAQFQRANNISPVVLEMGKDGKLVPKKDQDGLPIQNKQGTADFMSLISAMVNDFSKTRPHTAADLIDTIVRGGPGAGIAGMPAYMFMDFLSRGLSQGVSPEVMATVTTRGFTNLTDRLKRKKVWLDPANEKEMMDIQEGKLDYLGLQGTAGAFFYLIHGLLKSAKEGKINNSELQELLTIAAGGRYGRQSAVYGSVARSYMYNKEGSLTNVRDFEAEVRKIAAMQLGGINLKNLPSTLQDLVAAANKEGKTVAEQLEMYEARAKLSGRLFNIAVGQESAPLAKMLLGSFTKIMTGHSTKDLMSVFEKNGDTKWEDMGGLIGAIQNPAVKGVLLALGTAMLTAVGLQLGKIILRGGFGILDNLKQVPPFLTNKLGSSAFFGGPFRRKDSMLANNKFFEQMIADNVMVSTPYAVITPMQARQQLKASQRKTFSGKMHAMHVMAMRGIGLSKRQHLAKAATRFQAFGRGAGNLALMGGTAYALSDGGTDKLLDFIDSITTSSAQGVKKFSETNLGKGLGSGFEALSLMDVKNMISYYLLMSGNPAMATAAAMHLATKFFGEFYKGMNAGQKEWRTEDELNKASVKRAIAIGVAMHGWKLGQTGIAAAFGAMGYLGIDFLTQKGGIDIRSTAEQEDGTLLKNIKAKIDSGELQTQEEKIAYIAGLRKEINMYKEGAGGKFGSSPRPNYNTLSDAVMQDIEAKRQRAYGYQPNLSPSFEVKIDVKQEQNLNGFDDFKIGGVAIKPNNANKKTNFVIPDIPSYNTA